MSVFSVNPSGGTSISAKEGNVNVLIVQFDENENGNGEIGIIQNLESPILKQKIYTFLLF